MMDRMYRVSSKTVPTWVFALLSAPTHTNCKGSELLMMQVTQFGVLSFALNIIDTPIQIFTRYPVNGSYNWECVKCGVRVAPGCRDQWQCLGGAGDIKQWPGPPLVSLRLRHSSLTQSHVTCIKRFVGRNCTHVKSKVEVKVRPHLQ